MPRFFFDLHNDISIQDPEGQELPDVRSAMARAVKEARQMIIASVTDHGKIDLLHSIRVRDQSGTIVGQVEFGDAVSVRRGGERL